jgi:hypothetical protein
MDESSLVRVLRARVQAHHRGGRTDEYVAVVDEPTGEIPMPLEES